MVMDYVETRGFDGRVVEAYYVCRSCGFVGWAVGGDKRCPNEVFFGECMPRKGGRKVNPGRGKYRKTPDSQVNLDMKNIRKLFWGIKDEGEA